ncbi:hybrid sensor histidine kinase/response regulator transcription factor [Fulvivirga sediminis]|uniref:histidine kinase n=1 Tax=Fulvivirga sediminis TaxID=2803949 RepID=A0A937K004_9BACT|nr:hybrid sensor histidine kinase/response regulator transcription factor [Fulvivirga sediminis]MBL3655840.1 response regulator [Fulvivirga sediminis]
MSKFNDKTSKLKLKHVAMCLLFLWSSQVQAQLFKQYKFHRLNETHGLTNNVINDICQDTLGQIWVATNEGLFRYQGFSFQKFIKNKDNPNLLHNNFVEHLYRDNANRIWLMTDDGVGLYSYKNDIIERFMPDQLTGRISSMAVDKRGNYYFGKYESGLIKVSPDGDLTTIDGGSSEYDLNFSNYSILELSLVGEQLWAIVADLGVVCYNLKTEKVVFFSADEMVGRPKLKMTDLFIDHNQVVWVSTEYGVYAFSVKGNGTKHIDRSLQEVIPEGDYLTICEDRDYNLWIGSRQNGMYKIYRLPDGSYTIATHFTPRPDEYGISHRSISKILQDENGFFWVGTHNGGINVFNPDGEDVRSVTRQLQPSELSLSYQNVWGLSQSKSGNIWVGTDGKGLSSLEPATGRIQNNIYPELENHAILALMEDSYSRLWVGTYSDGIYLYDLKKNKKIKTINTSSSQSDLEVDDIRCFYEADDGKVYIGTNQGGLYVYEEETGYLRQLPGLLKLDIRSVTANDHDCLWLGTFGKGLVKYNLVREEVIPTSWSSDPQHKGDVIFDVYKHGKVLWVATRHNGVVLYDTRNEKFQKEPALEQINGLSVSGLQMDKNQNLWFTTNTGVYLLNRLSHELKKFGVENGFQSGHFNDGSIFLSKEGYLVLGGIHGMNLFYPEDLMDVPVMTDIVLNEFKIFNKAVNPANSPIFPEGKSIFLTKKVTLSYADNIFSVQFALPGYTTYAKHDFVYMLEGYEQKWQYGAESNLATYRNVPPGHYTFKVKSLQNGAEKKLKVVIEPPFWKTWQAYMFYVLVIILVIWRINKFSNSRISLKQKLEFEQELREKEKLVMQEKLRFYTNFSHELKTPLTLIQGPVNDLLKSVEDPQKRQYLKLIQKNTGIILKFIRRMLEFRKIEMNKITLNVGHHDLKILAQEEAESFSYLASEKEIKFGFYCQNDIEGWVDLEKIQVVMNNLLSNAFKFTPKGKKVNFGVFDEDDYLIIEVKDKGVGIRKEEVNSIFSPFFQASNSYTTGGTGIGLALCKSFVELHLGHIEVSSEEGAGTCFTVKIPKGKTKFEDKDYVRFINEKEVEAEASDMSEIGLEEEDSIQNTENEKVLLIVDDNKDISAYVKTLFDDEFRILCAENGVQAYDLAINNPPDIIISDMMMPGMDGLEFCAKIKENISTSHIPVIMLTAKDTNKDKITGYKVGADDYITKPFSSDILVARVNNLLKSRKMLELRYETNDLIHPDNVQNSKEVEFVLNTESIILQMMERSEFSVAALCKELGMSQSALYRKIKLLTGVSIQIFIRKIRIKQAAQLLLSEDMTVTEVAFALDFSDLKYFRKCFKEQFKMTPSEFKSTHSKTGNVKIELDSL